MVSMRVVAATVAVAVLTSGAATGGTAGWWSWLAVVVLTLLTPVASLWLHTVSHDEAPAPPVSTPPAPSVPPAPIVQQNAISFGGSIQQAAGDIANIDPTEGGGL
jgi:hypothetical protein